MDIPAEVSKIHQKLLNDICDEIPLNNPEHDNMKSLMKPYLGAGQLEGKTLHQQFEALTRKGHLKPGSYDVLKKICKDSGNENLVDYVKKAEYDIEHKQLTSTTTDGGIVGPSAPVYKQSHEDESDDVKFYPRDGKKGLMLILNSREDREDTDIDVQKIKSFFEDDLRYTVRDPRSDTSDDLSTQQLDGVLNDVKELMNSESGRKYYCFVCVILSHGNQNGIRTKDGYKDVEEIRRKFNNVNVPKFCGRPKIFMIQACRGSATQGGVETDIADDDVESTGQGSDSVDESDAVVKVPTDADTLLAFSTTPGYTSFRRPGVGSWFITECIHVFKQKYKKHHLEEMLITVRKRVALRWQERGGHGKQMPCVWTTLTQRLML